MRYTTDMQTKVGLHYHVRVGPPTVRLYDLQEYLGPFYDIVLDDMHDAHHMLVELVDRHLPEYFDEDDIYESLEYVEYMTDEVERGEMFSANIGVAESAFIFELIVCPECTPKGMN
jgi:hypothetical protein